MVKCSLLQWKKFIEGLYRGDVGPYEQLLVSKGKHRIRIYKNSKGKTKARMLVANQATNDGPEGATAPRRFKINRKDLKITSYIYIPTEDDLENWDDIEKEIALREV